MRILAGFIVALIIYLAWDSVGPTVTAADSAWHAVDRVSTYFFLFVATFIGGYIARRNFVPFAVLLVIAIYVLAAYIFEQVTLEPFLTFLEATWPQLLLGVVIAVLGGILGQRFYHYRIQILERSNNPLEDDG